MELTVGPDDSRMVCGLSPHREPAAGIPMIESTIFAPLSAVRGAPVETERKKDVP